MFRNEQLAGHSREIADLRSRLHSESEEKEELKRQLEEKERELMEMQAQNSLRTAGQRFLDRLYERNAERAKARLQRKMDRRKRKWEAYLASNRFKSRSFPLGTSRFDRESFLIKFFQAAVVATVATLVFYNIYQYFFGIQEGYVTDKHYTPAHTSCHPVSDGKGNTHTECTYYPDDYRLFIRDDNGDTNSWGVSSGTYEHTRNGEWFCYVDFFHDASDCHGPNGSY